MKTRNSISILLLSALLGLQVQAESLNPETQNMVIERMDRVLSQMEKTDSSWVPSNLRLADLLAERARLRFMQEIEAGCKACKGSEADRKRALAIFESIVKKSKVETQGAIFFQMGHLYQIAGQADKARQLFSQILKARKGLYPKEVVIRSRTSLADLQYENGKFKEALELYQQALKEPLTSNKGLITYRIGWCEFNLNRLASGTRTLEKLASTPALLTKDTANGLVHDAAFQSDVLRDLATFYSRQTVGAPQINRFQKLLPEDRHQRKELLFFFANEVDRLGQKKSASLIYQAYLKTPDLSKEEQLEAMVLLAQTTYDKGNSAQSVANFEVAAGTYRKMNCSAKEPKCADLQKRMKYFVTELHRSKKVKPDADLMKSYGIYVETFPEDTEMSMRGAVVADQTRTYPVSAKLFHLSADTATTEALKAEALAGEISASEKSNSPELRENAYNHYLALLPNGPRNYEVRYQLAQLSYEQKKFAKAADQFKVLALDVKGQAELRKKSADLSLDCLAAEARDEEIEKRSSEFAQAFPRHRVEFERIYRKALINQVARTTNNPKSSESDLKRSLEKLHNANLGSASETERILHYKNMMVLAEKTDSDKSMLTALSALLGIRSFKQHERESTLARTVAYFEKRLDFRSAYSLAMKMKFPSLRKAERELRLGTMADLADLSPRRHYEAALRAGLSKVTASSVRERLVLLSNRPSSEIHKHKQALLSSPQVLSDLILMVYAKQKSLSGLHSFLSNRKFSNLPAIKYLKAQSFHARHQKLDQKIAAHELNMKTDRSLQKSIQERIRLLSQADSDLNEAIGAKDLTGQILSLTTLARENDRMAKDLMRTPMPKGLTAAEQKRYVQILSSQTRPFSIKAQAASFKLQSIWKNESQFSGLIATYQRSRIEIQTVLRSEMQSLADVAPGSEVRSRLRTALSESLPSSRDLQAARENVRQNPENWVQIEKLKNIETKIGHPLMSSYLQGRLERIHKGKVL